MESDILESLLYFKKINPFIQKANYVGGVPNCNESFLIRFNPQRDRLVLSDASSNKEKIVLLRNDIISISVEDSSKIESNVKLTRLLLVGVFALAWKKRKTIPLSFLVIKYADKVSGVESILIQCSSNNSFQELTNVRYNLLKYWKDVDENINIEKLENQTIKTFQTEDAAQNKNLAIGCLVISIILIIIFLLLN